MWEQVQVSRVGKLLVVSSKIGETLKKQFALTICSLEGGQD